VSLTSSLSVVAPCFLPLHFGRAPFRFRSPPASSSRAAASRNGSHLANHGAGSAAMEPLNGDVVRPKRARERRPAGAERGGADPGMDHSAEDGS
jgi:hypothetical protein